MRGFGASVIIPTYNGEEFLDDLLDAVFKQTAEFKYEVIVIDSGSTDRTLDIVSQYPEVKLHTIPNIEFGHGRTRNLGARMAKGDIVVYLTQDAVPAHKDWLRYMVEPFLLNDKVFCVFGKQIPRPDCVVSVKREVHSVFKGLGPDHSLMVHRGSYLKSSDPFPSPLGFFSDVNSAARRTFLVNEIPFRDVNYSEDQALGSDVIAAGYLKVYAPYGSVVHSHDYPLKKYFARKYDEQIGLRAAMALEPQPIGIRRVIGEVFGSTLRDWIFVFLDNEYSISMKLKNYWVAPWYNINRLRAIQLGSKKELTESDRRKYSLETKSKKTIS